MVRLGLVLYGHYYVKKYALLEAGKYYGIDFGLGQYYLFSRLNRSVMFYDPVAKELDVPFTSELPFLYGRAIVLQSGCLPEKRGNWLTYRNVSAENAALVAQRLGQKVEKGINV